MDLTIGNWRLWVSLAISVGLLALLAYRADLDRITESLATANYLYALPASALYFVALYLRAARWRYVLAPLAAVPTRRVFPVVVVGYMANNLLPARLGEVVRAYWLARREPVSESSSLATIAVERVYDGLTLLAFAGCAAAILLASGHLAAPWAGSGEIYSLSVVGAAAIAAIFLVGLGVVVLSRHPQAAQLVEWMLRAVPNRMRPRARRLALDFLGGLSVLDSPGKHLTMIALSLPVWLVETGVYLLVAHAFGIHLLFDSYWTLLLVMVLLTATSNVAGGLPTGIGGIGPFEVAAQQTLLLFGVGAAVGAAYAGFLHLVALWIPVNLVGMAIIWKNSLSLRDLARGGKAGSPAESGVSPPRSPV